MKNINDRQVTEVAKSIASKKMSDYKDLTCGEFFAGVMRPLIELLGVEILPQSIEDELIKENKQFKEGLKEIKKELKNSEILQQSRENGLMEENKKLKKDIEKLKKSKKTQAK